MADLLAREKYLLKTRNYSLKPTVTQSVSVLKPLIFCNICMEEYEPHQAYKIVHCECVYCLECTFEYLRYQIINGAYKITCPDAKCSRKGCFSLNEIVDFVGKDLFEKHMKFRLDTEVAQDSKKAWCPKPDCNTVCLTYGAFFYCPQCQENFCKVCLNIWHGPLTCEEYGKNFFKATQALARSLLRISFCRCCLS